MWMYDKKIGKFGFHKNGAGIGENAYHVRYSFYFAYALPRLREPPLNGQDIADTAWNTNSSSDSVIKYVKFVSYFSW